MTAIGATLAALLSLGAGDRGGSPARAAADDAGVTARRISFNGRPLSAAQRGTLARLEQRIGTLPDGEYWYDPRSGAAGRWGGPALALLPAGLDLGGPLPANASGGGSGRLTGVFINGRELHPADVAGLMALLGQVWPGRWWVDGQGNFGAEGSPVPIGNLVAAARARNAAAPGGGRAWSSRYEGVTPSDTMNMASDGTTTCVSTGGYSRCTGE
jgi:hypothetical protein